MKYEHQLSEIWRCYSDCGYFINEYCYISDSVDRGWIRFRLWDGQQRALGVLGVSRKLVILKARQLGLTWLCLGYALWLCLFRPEQHVLLFSRRDVEAMHLLERLRGIYARLPSWMVTGAAVSVANRHEWKLENGSVVRAFPTSAGDGYTATLAFVDEADLVPDLRRLLSAVKPTVDAGGQLILLSRADKRFPNSTFKNLYRSVEGGWKGLFLSWREAPGRTEAWYEEECRHYLAATGSLDDMYEQYPATDAEALSARTTDKRLPADWLRSCYVAVTGLVSVNGAVVYKEPMPDSRYVIGVDPAEGNPSSDNSTICVLDNVTGEQMCTYAARVEPSLLAVTAAELSLLYNKAQVMVERNNHGHAVILWLRENAGINLCYGRDGRAGWLTNALSKVLMYTRLSEALRDGEVIIHDRDTYLELGSVDGDLNAPDGGHDDRAVAFCLAHMARLKRHVPIVSADRLSRGRMRVIAKPFLG